MTNQEKYKTAQEREQAFRQFCQTHVCMMGCPLRDMSKTSYACVLNWLEMEAEEGLLPCPFCGETPVCCHDEQLNVYWMKCFGCGLLTKDYDTKEEAIAAWNRRAK